ncbi:MAG: hypothetical protein GWO10_08215, partial [candidate division Zixibacteria bacterium]|nr:hypothetical protein [candidate division Zixibacteria bacterium]NIS14995.1 hypothetical protein [candidate division Zixibacteria bacterium]NIW39024.1 hypothetical protein [candidate division Zixibacteria bacterium]NIX55802.1 hypothetical protein [candidate division Zixibacteria bacterium]NIX78539.1 hypothetical protein [candidate division Zixibacteria bacterium]
AEIPEIINYQGRLAESNGSPVADGSYQITFKIYDSQVSTTYLWSSGEVSVLVINGLFNIQLGEAPMNPLPENLFSGSSRKYLGIQIGSDPELIPRILLTSASYAFHALFADTADYARNVSGEGNGWIDDGLKVRLSNSNDSVGIGTSNPESKLHVLTVGTSAKLGQNSYALFAEHTLSGSYGYMGGSNIGTYGYSNNLYGVQGNTTSGYGVWGGTGNSSGIGVYGENVNGNYGYLGGDQFAMFAHAGSGYAGYFEGNLGVSDYLGIGVLPDTKLHIAGGNWDLTASEGDFKIGDSNIRLKMGIATGGGGAGDARIRAQGGTNRLMLGSGADDIITLADNRVGIGTILPEATLHVNGNLHIEGTSNDLSWQSGEHLQIGDYNGTTFTERMRITSSGRVGIGTSSPQDKLEVNGNIRMDQGTGNGNFLRFAEAGTFRWTFLHRPWATASFALRDETGGIDLMAFEASTGNVGVKTTDPDATLDVNGDLVVRGAYRGNHGPNGGGAFPRPAYESAWITIPLGSDTVLTHNVGVDVNKYVVDLQLQDNTSFGINNFCLGYDRYETPDGVSAQGAYYKNLTTTTITIWRGAEAFEADKIRVRIWFIE